MKLPHEGAMFVDNVNKTDRHGENLKESNDNHDDVFWGCFVYHFLHVREMCNKRPEI